MADSTRSEDVLGEKWDRCISDTLIKSVSGIGLGIVFSAVFFKRRPWPLAFGLGVGLGMGYSNCQNDFQNPFLIHGKRIKMVKPDGRVSQMEESVQKRSKNLADEKSF